jgi:hypothetical protein
MNRLRIKEKENWPDQKFIHTKNVSTKVIQAILNQSNFNEIITFGSLKTKKYAIIFRLFKRLI